MIKNDDRKWNSTLYKSNSSSLAASCFNVWRLISNQFRIIQHEEHHLTFWFKVIFIISKSEQQFKLNKKNWKFFMGNWIRVGKTTHSSYDCLSAQHSVVASEKWIIFVWMWKMKKKKKHCWAKRHSTKSLLHSDTHEKFPSREYKVETIELSFQL